MDALESLEEGNLRYANGKPEHPNESVAHRQQLATGQSPFAVVLSCADSRVVPESIFDQGLGDLFTVRVAGNVIDDHVLGSIEYAVEHLGTRLVVVLGHESCGAVGAAIEGGTHNNHIDSLVSAIRPVVEEARRENPEDLLQASVKKNALQVAEEIRGSGEVFQKNDLDIRAAYYRLSDGVVEWM